MLVMGAKICMRVRPMKTSWVLHQNQTKFNGLKNVVARYKDNISSHICSYFSNQLLINCFGQYICRSVSAIPFQTSISLSKGLRQAMQSSPANSPRRISSISPASSENALHKPASRSSSISSAEDGEEGQRSNVVRRRPSFERIRKAGEGTNLDFFFLLYKQEKNLYAVSYRQRLQYGLI